MEYARRSDEPEGLIKGRLGIGIDSGQFDAIALGAREIEDAVAQVGANTAVGGKVEGENVRPGFAPQFVGTCAPVRRSLPEPPVRISLPGNDYLLT